MSKGGMSNNNPAYPEPIWPELCGTMLLEMNKEDREAVLENCRLMEEKWFEWYRRQQKEQLTADYHEFYMRETERRSFMAHINDQIDKGNIDLTTAEVGKTYTVEAPPEPSHH